MSDKCDKNCSNCTCRDGFQSEYVDDTGSVVSIKYEYTQPQESHTPVKYYTVKDGKLVLLDSQDITNSYDQPDPIKNTNPRVVDLVIADMESRAEFGNKKYNTYLQPNNGRDALVDAYQEALDLTQYLRQLIYERDNK